MKLAQPSFSDCTEWMLASPHLTLTELVVIHPFCVSVRHYGYLQPKLDRISGHYDIRCYGKSAKPFRWTYTDPSRRIKRNEITGTAH